jgi:hypothetical protein
MCDNQPDRWKALREEASKRMEDLTAEEILALRFVVTNWDGHPHPPVGLISAMTKLGGFHKYHEPNPDLDTEYWDWSYDQQ